MAKLLKKTKAYFIIGGPGVGKGEQCKKLAEAYNLTHVSTGELLRKEIERGTENGIRIKEAVERGDLVPSALVQTLLKETMIKEAATSQGFVIDGFPRDLQQGIVFEKEIVPIQKVLHFKAPDEVMKARLMKRAETTQRPDDSEEVYNSRIQTHNQNSKPILEYYAKKKKLFEINAEGSPSEVFLLAKAVMDKKK